MALVLVLIVFVLLIAVVFASIFLIYKKCCKKERSAVKLDHSDEPIDDDNDVADGLLTGKPDGKCEWEDNFLKLNEERGNDLDKKIDLHGLTCDQADVVLRRYMPRPTKMSNGQTFEIVTGRGNHSKDNIPKLYYHVQEKLERTYPKHWISSVNGNGSWIITERA